MVFVDALCDSFSEYWTVFMMCSVITFLSTGWCLWCTEWQVSWALDGVCWCTLWQVSWALDGVYDALSDKFPEHWMVFLVHSVTSFLGTGRCLWCIQWQFSWTLNSGHFCRYWYLSDWNHLHESFQMDIFSIKFYLYMCCLIFFNDYKKL